MNKSWIFCTPIPVVLRIYFPQVTKNQASREKHARCGPNAPSCTDPRNQLQKCFLATGSCSFKTKTTDALHGRSCNNFVALRAAVFETPVSCAEKKKIMRRLPADIYLQHSCTKMRCQECIRAESCCVAKELRNAFATNKLDDSKRKSVIADS